MSESSAKDFLNPGVGEDSVSGYVTPGDIKDAIGVIYTDLAPKASPTFTGTVTAPVINASGNVTVNKSTGSAQIQVKSTTNEVYLTMDGNGGGNYFDMKSSGVNRWSLFSTTGSELTLRRFDDAGASLGDILKFTRSTGKTTLAAVGSTAGLEFGTSGPRVMSGTGSPESVVTAPAGSEWIQTDHATLGYARWIKNSGTGNTGWLLMPEGRVWCEGVRTTNQSIPDAITTVVTYTSETDRYNMLNAGTGKITIPIAGLWEFSFTYQFPSDVANWNGSNILNETTGYPVALLRTSAGPFQQSMSGLMQCAANNVISCTIYQDSVGAQNVSYARFVATLVGT